MASFSRIEELSDAALLTEVRALAARERQVTADLIALLVELDARRLYLGAGYSSLFTYCTHALQLSEHAAYGRIEAARAARRFPEILARLGEGRLTLTAVCLLAPVLTHENHARLLESARHKSKREVECLVAQARPQPAVPSVVRKLPAPARSESATTSARNLAPAPAKPAAAPATPRAAVIAPLAPERYRVQFTVSRDTCDKFRSARDLLRHVIPNGDPALIFERALTLLVQDLEKRRFAAAARPRTERPASGRTRHVPASVRRQVWQRDDGRCAFIGTNGRCAERGFLEFHHVIPFAEGGETTVANLQLRCRAHNAYEAERCFGSLTAKEDRACFEANSVRTEFAPTLLATAGYMTGALSP